MQKIQLDLKRVDEIESRLLEVETAKSQTEGVERRLCLIDEVQLAVTIAV